ncbi:PqqD family protein [Cryobacterium sp. SO2]|uniref:PqqD family protein n=1 Tax=Cryobacterium sp. SO2 TaxID=1897060 RepID=UPI00223CA756|nr:PqqD family protein [Cryobacterium sp. SO2]WEO78033.1 PqqD family protein [Cryobacterium sp. SO2]
MTQTQPSAAARSAEVWSHSADAAVVEDGDDVFVLDLARLRSDGVPRAIQGSAGVIWRRIDGRASLGDIGAALAAEFAVQPAALQHDLTMFVDSLAAAGLLVRGADRG